MQDENGYTTIDLDADPTKVVAPEIEIVVDDEPKAVAPEVVVEEEEEEAPQKEGDEKGKLTRHQRLKASRDRAWQEAEAARAEAAAAKAELERIKQEANSAADVTYDYMLGTLDSKLKSFKDSYNQALASGDQEKLFDLQVQIAETVAAKRQMEASKPARPPQDASGKDTRPTTEATPTPKRTPLTAAAREWQEENSGWLNKDRGMTAVAKAIAEDLVAEGWAEMDNDYFDELDRRLKAEMPHKFKRKEAPTITARGQQQAPTGKMVVRLSQEEKALAAKMGVDIKEFARQKALMEAASKSDGYTEV